MFKKDWLEAECEARGIAWPWRTESGKEISTAKEHVKIARDMHPELKPFADGLLYAVNQLKNFNLEMAPGRMHVPANYPVRARTTRTQPTGIMIMSGWLHALAEARPGQVLITADYAAQEFRIMARLSRDDAMMKMAEAKDPYMALAIMAGAAPDGAIKDTHPRERAIYKQVNLAVMYNMGPKLLAEKTGLSMKEAKALLNRHRQLFPKFWAFSRKFADDARRNGFYVTKDGWRTIVPSDPRENATRLQNAPAQSTGAVMLRMAHRLCHERGVTICQAVHDSIIAAAPVERLEETKALMAAAMAEASAWALDGYECPVDFKETMPGEKMLDEEDEPFFEKAMSMLEAVEANPPDEMPVKKTVKPRGPVKPDWAEAEKFLHFLEPSPKSFTFKAIDNSPARTGAKSATLHLDQAKEWLDRQAAEPWGAYVSPNVMDRPRVRRCPRPCRPVLHGRS